MIHLGDITKINGAEVPPVDVVTGGSPCQDLSVAGKRAGLDGERSGLFMEQVRVTKEMREHYARTHRPDEPVRPRWLIWENVPGALSSNGGKDFQAVLTEIVRIANPDAPDVPLFGGGKRWAKAGCLMGIGANGQPFSVAYRVHDAQFWGVPQRRRRISLVADFGGLAAPEVLFERKGVSGDFEPGETAREETSADVGKGSCGVYNKEIVGTLSVSGYSKLGTQEAKNGMYIVQESWDGSQTSPTLTANNAGGSQRMPDKDNFNAVVSYGLDRASFNQGANAQYQFAVDEEKIGAQVARGHGAVCAAVDIRNGSENEDTNGTMQAKSNGGWNSNSNTICRQNAVVRRLTPLECERLQGFPDGWTDIGEWTDSKGKKHKDADSPRYKALGNSIALPFWQWLANRIAAQYDRPVEMASLFDGIGGFPLVFERAGGKAVWASEIEEFPIAVTKLRFPEAEE